ncbi:SCFD1, partial [Symbiodinium necroappetens]
DFEKRRTEMAGSGQQEDALAPGLAAAINALPEMTEKKRSIDMHTNIAHALVAEVKARELDRYYEFEDQLASQSLGTSVKELEQLLGSSQKGTLADKLR